MQKYGKLTENGDLLLSYEQQEGYKPIVCADIPEFDQTTQYIVQVAPVEKEDCIYFGIEIRQLELGEDEGEEFGEYE